MQLQISDKAAGFPPDAEIGGFGNERRDFPVSVPQQVVGGEHAGVFRFAVDGVDSVAGDVVFQKDQRDFAGEQPGDVLLRAVGKGVGQQRDVAEFAVQPAEEELPLLPGRNERA